MLEELQKVLFEQIDLRRRLEQEFQVLKGNASFPVFSKTHIYGFGVICGWVVIVRLLKWDRSVLSYVARILGIVLLWLFRPRQVFCRENLKLHVCCGVYFAGFDTAEYSEQTEMHLRLLGVLQCHHS